jgi:hypothetical protein
MMNPSHPDFHTETRTESAPPDTHRLVADVYTTLKQKIHDLPQRERMYIITARRMTSGEELKYRKGLRINGC